MISTNWSIVLALVGGEGRLVLGGHGRLVGERVVEAVLQRRGRRRRRRRRRAAVLRRVAGVLEGRDVDDDALRAAARCRRRSPATFQVTSPSAAVISTGRRRSGRRRRRAKSSADQHRALRQVGGAAAARSRSRAGRGRRGRWRRRRRSRRGSGEAGALPHDVGDAVDLVDAGRRCDEENGPVEDAADDEVAGEALLDRLVDEALAEEPMIAIAQARVRPIIRAEAVAAVRRGLRSEFCPARLPIEPNTPGVDEPARRAAAARRAPGSSR